MSDELKERIAEVTPYIIAITERKLSYISNATFPSVYQVKEKQRKQEGRKVVLLLRNQWSFVEA